MKLNDKQKTKCLFAIEGVGAAFVCVFLAAYLAGLPTTNVLHSEAFFRIPLAVLGTLFFALILVALILAANLRKT
jgi:hypothetical protein